MKDDINTQLAADPVAMIGGLAELGRGLDWQWHAVGDKTGLSTKSLFDLSGDQTARFADKNYRIGDRIKFNSSTSTNSGEDTFHDVESYYKRQTASVSLDVSYGAFSGGFKATFGKEISSLRDHAASVRTSSLTLWKLWVEIDWENTNAAFRTAVGELPKHFNGESRQAYYDFLTSYGMNVIHEVEVGGAVNYAVMVDKSRFRTASEVNVAVKAEYATFVSGEAKFDEKQTASANRQHITRNLSTRGGTYTFNSDPEKFLSELDRWRDTVPEAPLVFGVKTAPISRFVKDKDRRLALEQACQWFADRDILLAARWDASSLAIERDKSKPSRYQGSGPRLRIMVLDGDAQVVSDSHCAAPASHAGAAEFSEFWSKMADRVSQVDPAQGKLLLATECWPRDKRYCPPLHMREALLKHGANKDTLARWEALTARSTPSTLAGLTYVLAGNRLDVPGVDGLSAGYARHGEEVNAEVTIKAVLSHDAEGWLKLSRLADTVEASATPTVMLCNTLDGKALAAADDRTQLAMEAPDANSPRQRWYLYALPVRNERHGALKKPCALVNHDTNTLLRANFYNGEVTLQPFESNKAYPEDDVVWDHRDGNTNAHFLLAFSWGDGRCLDRFNNGVQVKKWRESGMFWNLIK